MLTKVFPTGEGKGYGPVEYLCSNPFGKGEREKAPVVLSGNPAWIRRQIDAVPFKHKYTSGVHSFAPEDKPTDEQIMEVIEATEELAFAGLPLSSRSILWVKHEHAGRTELHFLIPRQEVNSGKSFNAFPPCWQQKYDPLRDKFNFKYGWARPDDPEKARHWQPGINAKILADAKRKGKPNPKAEVFKLTDDLANMAMQGKLTNRSEIVSELRKRGYGINRQGKDYLTIIDNEGKKTRLKGTLFEENFNGSYWIKAEIAKFDKPNSEKLQVDQKLAAEADARLQEAIRKTAQYNLNSYILKEMGNEQSTGKQPAHSSYEQGRTEKTDGIRLASSKRAMAAVKESSDRKADETITLCPQQGLGASAKNGGGAASREDAQPLIREIPLPEQPFSGLGGCEGMGSQVERGNRDTVKQLYEWSNRHSQGNIGTSVGNYRWQPGKPGRNNGVNHGHTERVARQGIQSGKFLQDFRSLKKSTEKLEDCLARINQADKKLLDIDLGLHPVLENLDQISGQVTSALRKAHETRLLQRILSQSASIRPINTNNLLILKDEAVESLRVANEQKLLQKLVKSGSSLALANLQELFRHADVVHSYLVLAYDIKLLTGLAKVTCDLRIPNLGRVNEDAKQVFPALWKAFDYRQNEQLKWISQALEVPSLEILASKFKMVCHSLKRVNEFIILRQLNMLMVPFNLTKVSRLAAWSSLVLKKLKSTHKTRIITQIYKVERKRTKIIKNCHFHAEWAGDDLQKWDRVFAEYDKSPKKLKILESMLASAHRKFALILSDTQNLEEIQNRCGKDSFLQHEYGILKDKLEQYHSEKKEKESEQTEVENPIFEDEKTDKSYKLVINFRP